MYIVSTSMLLYAVNSHYTQNGCSQKCYDKHDYNDY